jgi:hypothetical protein
MSPSPRRTIGELVYKYQTTHKYVKDIYTEGIQDVATIRWFLNARGLLGPVQVIPIDMVDVPSGTTFTHNVPNNNRGRVMALAKTLDGALGSGGPVLCVCDKDFDDLLLGNVSSPSLIKTDYCSMESYTLSSSIVQTVTSASGWFPPDFDAFYISMCAALINVFRVRASNEKLGLGLRWSDPCKYLSLNSNGCVIFDVEMFIRIYGEKHHAKLQGQYEYFVASFDVPDVRNMIRGHDIACILMWVLKTVGAINVPSTTKDLELLFKSKLEIEKIGSESLFHHIETWGKTSQRRKS